MLRFAVVAMVAFSFLQVDSRLAANLILNPSFESPEIPVGQSFVIISPGESIGTGWQLGGTLGVNSSALVLRSGGLKSPVTIDGGQHVLFGTANEVGFLSQDINLLGSTHYQLKFRLGAESGMQAGILVNLLSNGSSILGGSRLFTNNRVGYTDVIVDFLANFSGQHQLMLTSANEGAFVDAFSLVAVPEPSALAFCLCLGPAILSRRRRKYH